MNTQANLLFQVCEHSGRTLETLIKRAGQFSMQTVVLTTYELICIVEKVHKEKFLIRSISPENIAIGLGDKIKNFHILDCFYFKKYWDSRTGQHIPCIEGKPMVREPVFATTHEHLGIEASRRDDLESLAYLALYMFTGSLPWKENVLTDNPKENYPIITTKKLNLSPETLFTGYPCSLGSQRPVRGAAEVRQGSAFRRSAGLRVAQESLLGPLQHPPLQSKHGTRLGQERGSLLSRRSTQTLMKMTTMAKKKQKMRTKKATTSTTNSLPSSSFLAQRKCRRIRLPLAQSSLQGLNETSLNFLLKLIHESN